MNYKMVLSIIGKTLIIEAVLMLCPMLVGIIYGENNYLSFLIPILGLFVIGLPFANIKMKDKSIYAKEGFVTVALCWILMSAFGALPFVISGEIPSYIDAFFETVSGFTTTGSSILKDIEALSRDMLFWRSFTHWIGGMGVLVFLLAVIPQSDSGIMHVFRAESPGPSVSKLVSKLTHTARILYAIYVVMTAVMFVMLVAGGMPVFDSLVNSFATAGTGGFATKNLSIAHYNSVYSEIVIAVFMLLFGINFNFYYLILIGNVKKAFKSEELRTYLIITIVATVIITINILSSCASFGEALRFSFFQVTSVSSTTGFSTVNFVEWPAFSKGVLLILTVVGACGGSTGGGFKVSRLVILVKSTFKDVKKLTYPRSVPSVKFENEPVGRDVERNVRSLFIILMLLIAIVTLMLCIDCNDFFTNLSATLTCIGNVGPGLTELVGPLGNFSFYSPLSKILLSLTMLAGRLEIFPILILFAPRTWKRG